MPKTKAPAPKPPVNRLLTFQFYWDTAEEHGEMSGDDHEFGDLHTYMGTMWSLLTPEQRLAFAKHRDVQMTLEAVVDVSEDLKALP